MPEPTLERIQAMMQQILDGQHAIRDDIQEIKGRIGRLETEAVELHVAFAALSTRLDRFGLRLDRIEKRLNLVET